MLDSNVCLPWESLNVESSTHSILIRTQTFDLIYIITLGVKYWWEWNIKTID